MWSYCFLKKKKQPQLKQLEYTIKFQWFPRNEQTHTDTLQDNYWIHQYTQFWKATNFLINFFEKLWSKWFRSLIFTVVIFNVALWSFFFALNVISNSPFRNNARDNEESACGLYGYKMTFIVSEDKYLKKRTQWLFPTKAIQAVLQLKISRFKLGKKKLFHAQVGTQYLTNSDTAYWVAMNQRLQVSPSNNFPVFVFFKGWSKDWHLYQSYYI